MNAITKFSNRSYLLLLPSFATVQPLEMEYGFITIGLALEG
jgi:hypothetical protein